LLKPEKALPKRVKPLSKRILDFGFAKGKTGRSRRVSAWRWAAAVRRTAEPNSRVT